MEPAFRTYRDLFTLMREEPQAKAYFAQLPPQVQEQLCTRAFRVNSMESMRTSAEQLIHVESF